jgi:hypothetical protein
MRIRSPAGRFLLQAGSPPPPPSLPPRRRSSRTRRARRRNPRGRCSFRHAQNSAMLSSMMWPLRSSTNIGLSKPRSPETAALCLERRARRSVRSAIRCFPTVSRVYVPRGSERYRGVRDPRKH